MAGWKRKGRLYKRENLNQVHEACYPSGSRGRKWAGYLCIFLGAVLIILCVPLRAWGAVLGIFLIALGVIISAG